MVYNYIKKKGKLIIVALLLSVISNIALIANSNAISDLDAPIRIKIDNAMEKAENAAKVRLLGMIVKNCTGSIDYNISGSKVRSGAIGIYENTFAGDTNVATGAWVEHIVQGSPKEPDGEIYCYQDKSGGETGVIAKEFATAAGIQINSELYCLGSDHGIVIGYKTKDGLFSSPKRASDCSSAKYYGVRGGQESESKDNLKTSYEKARKNNEYIASWSKVSDWDEGSLGKADAYYVYKHDAIDCKSDGACFCIQDYWPMSYVGGGLSMDKKSVEINMVNYDGSVTAPKYDSFFEAHTINSTMMGRSGPNCASYLETINEYATEYRKKIKGIYEDECKDAVLEAIGQRIDAANAIINEKSKYKKELVDRATKVVEELNAIKTKINGSKSASVTESDDTVGTGKLVEKSIECIDLSEYNIEITSDDYNGSDTFNEEDSLLAGKKSDETDPCYTEGGAYGWIICPIVTAAEKVISWMYEEIVQPLLVIEVKLVDTSSDTYKAWSSFRDIANIAFVIAFLAVILSQVTGVGIDNYGIKKILPKLIIVAVLINISYFLCQLAVDISNILGMSLNNLLASFTPEPKIDGTTVVAKNTTGAVIGTLATAAVGAIIISQAGLGAVLTALIGLLSVVISLLMMLVLMSIRKAAIVILVVISPLAVVCYMLPNTKKMFDRYIGIFKALLMMYPIAGILIGGGNLAAGIIIGSNSEGLMPMIGMICEVAPFFMLPSLTRKAVDAVGNISSKVQGFGRGLNRQTAGRLHSANQNSAYNKAFQAKRAVAKDAKIINAKAKMARRRQEFRNGAIGSRLTSASDKASTWWSNARNNGAQGINSAAQSFKNKHETLGAIPAWLAQKNEDKSNTLKAERDNFREFNKQRTEASDMANMRAMSGDRLALEQSAVRSLQDDAITGKVMENGQQLNTRNAASMQRALQGALESGDSRKVKAYSNIMMQNQMFDGIQNAQQAASRTLTSQVSSGASGAAVESQARAQIDLAQNIADNHMGTAKDNHAVMADWAKKMQGKTHEEVISSATATTQMPLSAYDDNGNAMLDANGNHKIEMQDVSGNSMFATTYATGALGSMTEQRLANQEASAIQQMANADSNATAKLATRSLTNSNVQIKQKNEAKLRQVIVNNRNQGQNPNNP